MTSMANYGVRTQIATSALFKELSWLTNIVFSTEGLGRACSGTAWAEFADAVDRFETTNLFQEAHAPFRQELRIGCPVTDRLAALGEDEPITSGHTDTSRLAIDILNYRLLDVLQWLRVPSVNISLSRGVRFENLPSKHLGRLGYNQLTNSWKTVIDSAVLSIRNHCEGSAIYASGHKTRSNPLLRLLSSVNQWTMNIRASKILRNLGIAAFHMGFLLKGNLDLPEEFTDLMTAIKGFSDEDAPDACNDIDGDLQNLRALRLPLQVALAVSPLYLLLDINLSRREADRGSLLKAWACMGDAKPNALLSAEKYLWNFLFKLAQGEGEFMPLVDELLLVLESIDYGTLRKNELQWFNMNYRPTPPPQNAIFPDPEFGRTNAHEGLSLSPPTPSQIADQVPREGTPTASGKTKSPSPSNISSPLSEAPSPVPEPVAGPKKGRKGKNKKNADVSRTKAGVIADSRKRSRSKSEDDLDDIVIIRHMIDLSGDLEDEKAPESVGFDDRYLEKVSGDRVVELHGPLDSIRYTPRFHFQKDVDRFYTIEERAQTSGNEKKPLFISDPEQSIIKVMTQEEFDCKRPEEIQAIFSKQHIVISHAPNQAVKFDEEALLEIAREDQLLSVNDLSVEVKNGNLNSRLCSATLKEVLNHGLRDGKSLNALDLPMEGGVRPTDALSSDLWAWRHTNGLKLCKRTDRFPSAAVQWALISTAGAHSPWHIDPDGLATMVVVKSGCKWWILARPKKGAKYPSFSAIGTFLDGFDVEAVNDDRWEYEAILLTAGTTLYMRPNTPHLVFTLESSVCHGAHFYSTSVIRDSCYGLMHSFLARNYVANTEHEPESRELLRRLITYYHKVYVGRQPSDLNLPINQHCPDPSTFKGTVDLLTLCNIMELCNVLYSKTYSIEGISTREYLDFIEGRKIAKELLEWHHRWFEILRGNGHPMRIFDIQRSYLRRQVHASAFYLAAIDEEEAQEQSGSEEITHITSKMFKEQIESTFDYASELLVEEAMGGSTTDASLGWSPEIEFTVRKRPTPLPVRRPVPEGMTAADRVYGRSLSMKPDSTITQDYRTSDNAPHQGSPYRVIANSKDAPRLRKRRKM